MANTTKNTQTIKNVKVIENVKNSELTNEQIKAMYKEIRKNEKAEKEIKKAENKENKKYIALRNDIKNNLKGFTKKGIKQYIKTCKDFNKLVLINEIITDLKSNI